MALPGEHVASLIGPLTARQIQPAGIDLRVDSVHRFLGYGVMGENRLIPETEEVEPDNGYWILRPGPYKIRFAEVVEVPLDLVGFCFPRSSLLRMGALLACAVWDPGYRGRGEALLVVFNEHGIRIETGARIAQLVFIRMEKRARRGYAGSYLNENLDKR